MSLGCLARSTAWAASVETADGRVTAVTGEKGTYPADAVIVADIYAAGEAPIDGVSRDALVAGMKQRGHRFAAPGSRVPDLQNRRHVVVGPPQVERTARHHHCHGGCTGRDDRLQLLQLASG